MREVDGCWTLTCDPNVPAPSHDHVALWHLAVDCFDSYSSSAFGEGGTACPAGTGVGDAGTACALLSRAWSTFRCGVARWDDDVLWRPLGPAWGSAAGRTNLDLALHAGRELIHHGAEIALLRDLHAATDGAQIG